jgi:hypothetical protein
VGSVYRKGRENATFMPSWEGVLYFSPGALSRNPYFKPYFADFLIKTLDT